MNRPERSESHFMVLYLPQGLKSRTESKESEAALVRSTIGELLTRVEPAEDLIEEGLTNSMVGVQGMRRPLSARTWRRYLPLAYRLARSSACAAVAPAGRILTT